MAPMRAKGEPDNMSSQRGPIMVAANVATIRHEAKSLSCGDVARLAEQVHDERSAEMILLDLRSTSETSTAALAKLILLRRSLIKAGRDLRVTDMAGGADALYKICRLAGLLPHLEHEAGLERRCT